MLLHFYNWRRQTFFFLPPFVVFVFGGAKILISNSTPDVSNLLTLHYDIAVVLQTRGFMLVAILGTHAGCGLQFAHPQPQLFWNSLGGMGVDLLGCW